jgi:regulatory protein
MAGKITGLRTQQRTPDRVNVYLDGEFAFGLPAIYAARLKVGQQLNDDEIEQLQATDLVERAYDRSVRFLGYRPRSEAEVRRYLAQKGIEPAVVDLVLDRLRGQGYLDDAEFARYWVENRTRFRPRGARVLRHELRLKGVDSAVIEEATASIETGSLAYEAGRPQAERLVALAQSDPAAFRRRLLAFLMRRGFDYAEARDAVNDLARSMGGESLPDADE